MIKFNKFTFQEENNWNWNDLPWSLINDTIKDIMKLDNINEIKLGNLKTLVNLINNYDWIHSIMNSSVYDIFKKYYKKTIEENIDKENNTIEEFAKKIKWFSGDKNNEVEIMDFVLKKIFWDNK